MKKRGGLFITFEGVEGSGKTTQAKRLAAFLRRHNVNALLTREPGGTPEGKSMRKILLNSKNRGLAPSAELFLYFADRAAHVQRVIRPALNQGTLVLCDRFADSTAAYQGHGRRLSMEFLKAAHELATGGLCPNLTFLLDLPVEEGLARSLGRLKKAGKLQREGRIEGESMAFHRCVRRGYLRLAKREPRRFVVLDARQSPAELARAVRNMVMKRFPKYLNLKSYREKRRA